MEHGNYGNCIRQAPCCILLLERFHWNKASGLHNFNSGGGGGAFAHRVLSILDLFCFHLVVLNCPSIACLPPLPPPPLTFKV